MLVCCISRYFPFNRVVRAAAFRSKLNLFSSKDENFVSKELGTFLLLFPYLLIAFHFRYFPFNRVVRIVAFRSKQNLFSSKDDNFVSEKMGTFPPWVLDEEGERLYARAEALGCSRVCLSRRAATEEFILAKGATTGYAMNCILSYDE